MTDRYTVADLERFALRVLFNAGADPEQAEIVSASLVWSNATGRPDHGLWRLPAYLERFRRGLIRCPCHPVVSRPAPALVSVDGDNGFGHYVGHVSMHEAISTAAVTGIGLAAVHNSNHFGAAGYFVNLAADANMLGIATSNSVAKVAPHGGVRPVFGTNPIAFGVPRSRQRPIIFDMATAAVSGASLLRAGDEGTPIPDGVVVDRQGRWITDVSELGDGALVPFGGAKGAGIALLVELLAGVITGATLSRDVRSMFDDFSGSAAIGHCFIALDVGRLMDFGDYTARLDDLLGDMTTSGPADGSVRLPGDRGWVALDAAEVVGVDLDPATRRGLEELAERSGIAFPDCVVVDRG